MNTTAANKTTPQETELSNRVRRVLTPQSALFCRVGFLLWLELASFFRLFWALTKTGSGCGNSTTPAYSGPISPPSGESSASH